VKLNDWVAVVASARRVVVGSVAAAPAADLAFVVAVDLVVAPAAARWVVHPKVAVAQVDLRVGLRSAVRPGEDLVA
jgi:hypothetical protein